MLLKQIDGPKRVPWVEVATCQCMKQGIAGLGIREIPRDMAIDRIPCRQRTTGWRRVQQRFQTIDVKVAYCLVDGFAVLNAPPGVRRDPLRLGDGLRGGVATVRV